MEKYLISSYINQIANQIFFWETPKNKICQERESEAELNRLMVFWAISFFSVDISSLLIKQCTVLQAG